LDYFEQCCETKDILPPDHKPTPPPPVIDPTKPDEPLHQHCGFRNVEGVGFRITGNNDHESEYGKN
jgi:hypothetical protein